MMGSLALAKVFALRVLLF